MGELNLSAPRKLSPGDLLEEFCSGEPELDEWLKRRALDNESAGASRTYLLCSGSRVIGYYTLATGGVARASMPGKLRRNMPDLIPIMILGRLAVDVTAQGMGLGSFLLKDAILRTRQVAEIAGVKALVVHPISARAARFYLRWGFLETPLGAQQLALPLDFAG